MSIRHNLKLLIKNEATDLAKAPIILQDYVSDRIGNKEMVEPLHAEPVNTNKMKSGLYHHTLEDKLNDGDIIHGLSTSSDPYDHAAYVAKLEGYKEKTPKGYKLKAQLSQVRPEHKGKGYGKQLYLAALAHHGEMDSDNRLTNRSNKVWESLPELSNGIVKVKLGGKTRLSDLHTGNQDTQSVHNAIADQDALKNMLYGDDKLAASEKDVVVETEKDKPVLEKPFKSKKQLRFLAANKEKIGGEKGFKEWLSHTPKNIPESAEKGDNH